VNTMEKILAMPSATAIIAQFVSNLRYENIPSAVISHVKLCILDTIGCALYGSTLPWGKTIIQFVKECGAGLASKRLKPSQIERLFDAVHTLERADDVKLSELLTSRADQRSLGARNIGPLGISWLLRFY